MSAEQLSGQWGGWWEIRNPPSDLWWVWGDLNLRPTTADGKIQLISLLRNVANTAVYLNRSGRDTHPFGLLRCLWTWAAAMWKVHRLICTFGMENVLSRLVSAHGCPKNQHVVDYKIKKWLRSGRIYAIKKNPEFIIQFLWNCIVLLCVFVKVWRITCIKNITETSSRISSI